MCRGITVDPLSPPQPPYISPSIFSSFACLYQEKDLEWQEDTPRGVCMLRIEMKETVLESLWCHSAEAIVQNDLPLFISVFIS